jgi:hypothetical protein
MCDYSLELYNNRAAEDNEDLVVKKFASGSQGFVADEDSNCAVCCKSGVEMVLLFDGDVGVVLWEGHDATHERYNLSGETPVVFHTLGKDMPVCYRDGFMLLNGRWLSIQNLPVGACARVTKALPREIVEAVSSGVAFSEEIRVQEIVAPICVD